MLKRTLPTAVLAHREQIAVPLGELVCHSRLNVGALAVPAHKEIRATVRKFVDAEINPHVDAWEAARRFPAHALFKKMGSLGLLGVNKPVIFLYLFSYVLASASFLFRSSTADLALTSAHQWLSLRSLGGCVVELCQWRLGFKLVSFILS
jgi:alkylation response protein AidB-like acyl-CoA dehydrogenase